jgi:hypothetical protein
MNELHRFGMKFVEDILMNYKILSISFINPDFDESPNRSINNIGP